MSNQKYQREAKEDRPVVAICYDCKCLIITRP